MTLTVPKAGTIAGRAADTASAIGRIAGARAEVAGDIAAFGNRMLQHGLQWKAEQRAMQVRRTELDIARDMGAARLEVEQIGDPAQIGPTWDAKVAEIKAKYITDDMDPEAAAALDLSLQGLGDKHTLALSEKTINLGRSQQEAQWIEMRQVITTEAAKADPTTFQAMIEMGEASIDERVAKGLIDPAAGAREKQALRTEVYSARAMTAIETDPAAALAAAEAGEFDALGAEGVAKLKLDAQGEIDRRTAAQAKADEAAAKARADQIGTRLKAIAGGAEKGRVVVDEAYLSDPEVQAHPDYAKAKAMVELRKESPSLDVMTVAQLDAAIEAEKKRPITEPWENERLAVLQGMRDKKAAAYATDPKAAAAASGIPAPALPDFDPADPGAFADALAASVSHDSYLRQQGYTNRPAIFTTEEKAAVKPILDPKAEAGPKVALLEAILQGTGGNPGPVLAELEADPVVRRGLKVLGLTGDRELTKAMLRGGQKIAEETVIAPSARDQVLIFDELTGGVFDDMPAVKAEVMEAALALYGDSATGLDPTDDPDTFAEAYGTAVQRLLGAQPDQNGELTIGGLQEVAGSLTVLPPGVAVREVEDAWEKLTDHLNGVVYDPALSGAQAMAGADPSALREGFDAPVPEAADPLRAFKAASLYGGVPDLGGSPATFFEGLTLHRLGESDVYEFRYESGGRSFTVPQTDGTAYRFRLKDLIRGAQQ